MGGMKEGSTGNPFESDEEESEDTEHEEVMEDGSDPITETPASDSTTEPNSDSEVSENQNMDDDKRESTTVSSSDSNDEPDLSGETGEAAVELRNRPSSLATEFTPENYDLPHPWALGREGVKDGRPIEKTFFLQNSVVDLEQEAMAEVAEILDNQVKMTDFREAAVIVAYSNPELIAELLTEWGAEHD
jgi:hypothetical protein